MYRTLAPFRLGPKLGDEKFNFKKTISIQEVQEFENYGRPNGLVPLVEANFRILEILSLDVGLIPFVLNCIYDYITTIH